MLATDLLPADQIRLQADPSCKAMNRSLMSLEFKLVMAVPDPNSDHGHMSDALGYVSLVLSKGLSPWKVGKASRSLKSTNTRRSSSLK